MIVSLRKQQNFWHPRGNEDVTAGSIITASENVTNFWWMTFQSMGSCHLFYFLLRTKKGGLVFCFCCCCLTNKLLVTCPSFQHIYLFVKWCIDKRWFLICIQKKWVSTGSPQQRKASHKEERTVQQCSSVLSNQQSICQGITLSATT